MDSFQQPAFSFIAPNEEFNPEHVPVDGEQYLQQMFHERSKCPAIVVASTRNDMNIIKQSNEMWKLEVGKRCRLSVFFSVSYGMNVR